jgi:hypothetical protein
MASERERLLELLASDAEVRAALVETLRGAAEALEPTKAHLAGALRGVSRALCDHARARSDGSCRYCDRAHVIRPWEAN